MRVLQIAKTPSSKFGGFGRNLGSTVQFLVQLQAGNWICRYGYQNWIDQNPKPVNIGHAITIWYHAKQ